MAACTDAAIPSPYLCQSVLPPDGNVVYSVFLFLAAFNEHHFQQHDGDLRGSFKTGQGGTTNNIPDACWRAEITGKKKTTKES